MYSMDVDMFSGFSAIIFYLISKLIFIPYVRKLSKNLENVNFFLIAVTL